jgi:DNA-binding response OmpR family regulator
MIIENTTQIEDFDSALLRDPQPRYHILLVDDDTSLREFHAEVLIRSGYVVDTAADGAIAWNTLNEKGYDLLITDNNMPKLTGLELIKQMRSEGMELPVILASGTVPMEELNQNSRLRIEFTLPKPFKTDELLAAVKKVLCK